MESNIFKNKIIEELIIQNRFIEDTIPLFIKTTRSKSLAFDSDKRKLSLTGSDSEPGTKSNMVAESKSFTYSNTSNTSPFIS